LPCKEWQLCNLNKKYLILGMSLIYQIGADASQYNATMGGLGQTASSASNQVSQSLAEASRATDNLGGAAMSTSMRFQTMRSGVSAARDGVMAFTLGGQAAERSLMAMGHHINSLVNETGSFKGAMASLGSSLWGVGGVILGITVLAEIFSHYSKAQKEAQKGGDEYISTLSAIDQALLKGAESGAKATTRLQILYQATQNHTLSMVDRNKAYDELEGKYPAFFTNADREKTLLGENTIAYNKLKDAILSAAYAKAAEDQIGVNANRQLENQKKATDLATEQAKAQKRVDAAHKSITEDRNAYLPESPADQAAMVRGQEKIRDLIKQQNDLKTDSNKLDKQNATLLEIAAKNENKAGYKIDPGSTDTAKVAHHKTLLEALELQLKGLQDQENKWIEAGNKEDFYNLSARQRNINSIIEKIKELKDADKGVAEPILKQAGFNIGDMSQRGMSENKQKTGAAFGDSDTILKMQAQVKAFKLYNDELKAGKSETDAFNKANKDSDTVLKSLTRTIGAGLTNAFMSALSGTESFVQAMGGFLKSLVEKLIAAALAAAALYALLSFTGLGAFLGISASASSFGSLFAGLSGLKGLALADGGITMGPTRALIGEGREKEAVMPLSKLNQFVSNSGGGKVHFEPILIGGDMLLKQIDRANRSKGRRK
jgi:hemerythrin